MVSCLPTLSLTLTLYFYVPSQLQSEVKQTPTHGPIKHPQFVKQVKSEVVKFRLKQNIYVSKFIIIQDSFNMKKELLQLLRSTTRIPPNPENVQKLPATTDEPTLSDAD